MKLKIIMLLMLLGVGFNAFPQFVGDAAPVGSTNPIKTNKPSFTLKIGLAMPSGNMGIAPSNGTTPKYTEGYMGAKTGFFAEVGFGLNMIKPEKKVSFYYYPLLVAFWKTNLDWSGNNDPIFDEKEVYLKPLRGFEIAQRYGIGFKPMDQMLVALYYRPGLLIPLTFDIASKTNDFQFSGTLSTDKKAPVLILSSTVGLSVKYSIFSLSFEKYFVKPTYDVTFNLEGPAPAPATTVMSKIPLKMNLLSLALAF